MSKTTQDIKKVEGQDKRLSHGIYSWLKTGRINPSIRGYKKLQRYLEDIEKNLIDDLGGPENLTAAKEILIKGTIEAYGVVFLATMYCKKYSILRPDKARKNVLELQPVLGHQFIAFMNTIRQNLIALGLDRKRADEALDLGKYVAEKYGEKEEKNGKAKIDP